MTRVALLTTVNSRSAGGLYTSVRYLGLLKTLTEVLAMSRQHIDSMKQNAQSCLEQSL